MFFLNEDEGDHKQRRQRTLKEANIADVSISFLYLSTCSYLHMNIIFSKLPHCHNLHY